MPASDKGCASARERSFQHCVLAESHRSADCKSFRIASTSASETLSRCLAVGHFDRTAFMPQGTPDHLKKLATSHQDDEAGNDADGVSQRMVKLLQAREDERRLMQLLMCGRNLAGVLPCPFYQCITRCASLSDSSYCKTQRQIQDHGLSLVCWCLD